MPRYEFTAIAAPRKGKSGKGVKGREAKFAHALGEVLNEMGADGWDYVRTDMLPCDERSGLLGSTTTDMHMMIFRRELPEQGRRGAGQVRADSRMPAPGRDQAARGATGSDDGDEDEAPMDDAAAAGSAPRAQAPRTSSVEARPESRDKAEPGRAPRVQGEDRGSGGRG
ncbi:hypothetical protein BV394_13335 [Brevirhabdus pacifica]|uniref:Uncharacterized protein n=1 Tax=Brevirhabdus pacifica TaxID=1267768 RepID=A0A1U7DL40_9RHOB|nr:hypothetical protein [Brevirhabdus pacifica]APX90578.1 hypothetical protein BV394_13335 [Brevirhabdus pacifica]PJJ85289.1 hypothetical protein CLV77_2155 [Brevirhabdus pacifica]